MNQRSNLKFKENKGITLIALVITIIVMLILVPVTVTVSLRGNLFNSSKDATDKTQLEADREYLLPAVMGALDENRKVDYNILDNNLPKGFKKIFRGIYTSSAGNTFIVEEDNKIINAVMVKDVQGKILSETSNTVVYDGYGNRVIIPAGFKITTDSNYVTDGIVIEDVTEGTPTRGSQFVWIPVGKVTKEDGTTVDIELNRYTFDSSGNETAWGSNIINSKYKEESIKTQANYIAEGIGTFKLSAIINGGYYIGRYEARQTQKSDGTNQVVCHTDAPVFTSLSQPEASLLSRWMYDENTQTNVTSDLINSYAWDTALLFIQECNSNKTYSKSNFTSNPDSDVICNIYNMSSNCVEWTTETSYGDYGVAVFRGGGGVYTAFDASNRVGVVQTEGGAEGGAGARTSYSFRPILYLRTEGRLMVTDVQGQVLSTTSNTEVYDDCGNKIIVPKGFKITEDGDRVIDGIVLEDATQGTLTQGSQFVWIPVGKIIKDDGTTVNIELNRYTFDSNGTKIAWGDRIINDKYLEETTKTKDNRIAENLEAFKTSVSNNGGYYIGRYEARRSEKQTSDGKNQVVCHTNASVFTWICQIEASYLSQWMYDENTQTNVTSDLINSYAWDTAIAFIQECSANKKYSHANFTSGSGADPNADIVCNIYNMASGCVEWTTETSYGDYGVAVFRGGSNDVYYGFDASARIGVNHLEGQSGVANSIATTYSFRPILYL